jgi:hypothetical protein
MDDAMSEQNGIACHCWDRPDMLEGFFVRQGNRIGSGASSSLESPAVT